jgi:hypothetical protein
LHGVIHIERLRRSAASRFHPDYFVHSIIRYILFISRIQYCHNFVVINDTVKVQFKMITFVTDLSLYQFIIIIIMERIVLEVDDRIANAWRSSSPVFKSRMEKEIRFQISRWLKEARRNEFKHALNEMRNEAAANGFTEEIFEQIRDEDEQICF